MNRRKFLSVLSGAAAAVAGGLGLKAAAETPAVAHVDPANFVFGAGKPYEKTLLLVQVEPCWRWKTLEEIVDAAALNQKILDAIEDRLNADFEQLVRHNERYIFGDGNALRS